MKTFQISEAQVLKTDSQGATQAVRDIPPGFLTRSWTHLCPCGSSGIFFYDSQSGICASTTISAGGDVLTVASHQAGAGWTHVAGGRLGVVLFYNAANGHGITAKFDGANFRSLKTFRNFSSGWTSIVRAGDDRLLFYNSATGSGVMTRLIAKLDLSGMPPVPFEPIPERPKIRSLTTAGATGAATSAQTAHPAPELEEREGDIITLRSYSEFSAGWGHIVELEGHLLFYNPVNRQTVIAKINADYSLITTASFPPGYFGEWTHIIRGSGSILIFMNARTGAAGVGAVDRSGQFINLQDYPAPGFGTRWTHAVASGNLVLQYRSSTGAPWIAPEVLEVAVTIDNAFCLKSTSDDDRDEVYLIVRRIASTDETVILPSSDDYYEFSTGHPGGWTNQDQVTQDYPILWRGRLAEGETAQVHVLVAEQDNADLAGILRLSGNIAAIAAPIVGSFFGPAGSAVGGAVGKFLNEAVKLVKDNDHDAIGAFSVGLANENGQLKTAWVPGPDTAAVEPNSASLTCTGGGSHYNVSAAATARPVNAEDPIEKRRVHLGFVKGGCNHDVITVEGIEVRHGESKAVRVNGRKFHWLCGSNDESDQALRGTNLLHVRREGRTIYFDCFREE